ncbi:Os01g0632200 [Oryza sativa Japonica Group]|uniref:Os01g0632200 protein n=2 Tax=Oryza sativa TaxID=4530 RepID=A0A0P0V5L7_ORYSJ|nr:hypothetical protein OsI_02963 [Oryza sativa Indica Group]BAS73306.1 Os01g0632200 [Oryza sativa Japonica Group]
MVAVGQQEGSGRENKSNGKKRNLPASWEHHVGIAAGPCCNQACCLIRRDEEDGGSSLLRVANSLHLGFSTRSSEFSSIYTATLPCQGRRRHKQRRWKKRAASG